MSVHNGDDLIIERPDLQTWPTLLGSRLFTAAMWVLYTYLWLPLLTLFAWMLGMRVAYQQMVEFGGYHIVLGLGLMITVVILLLGGGLLTWARINFYRFRDVERRQGAGPTDRDRLTADFLLSTPQLATLERSRRIRMDHHPNGDISHVEIMPIGQPTIRAAAPQPSVSETP